MAYSGQRPAGMQEGCTGSQGPQRIGELEKKEQEEEKREKKNEETTKEKKKTRKKGQ